MHPVLFDLFGVTFYTHGVMAVIGIALGGFLAYLVARRKQLNCEFLFDNLVFMVLFGIIGARIAYYIIYRNQFDNFLQIIYIWNGGLVSYGGFILGGIALFFLLKNQQQPVFQWLDIISISFFLALFIGRIGDIFAGEYAGIPIQNNTYQLFNNINVVPVPFYESILCIVIFALSFLVYQKYYSKLTSGVLFFASVASYSLGRFILDFWRDEQNLISILSLGQVVSIILLLCSLYGLSILVKRNNKEYKTVK